MTATERDEMERVAKYMEENPGESPWVAIRRILGLKFTDDWPLWLEDAFIRVCTSSVTGFASTSCFVSVIRDRLRTEPTCTG